MHGDTVEVAVHRCQEVGDFYVALLLRNMQSLGAVLARGPREAGFELGHGRQLSQFAISLRPTPPTMRNGRFDRTFSQLGIPAIDDWSANR